MKSNQKLNQEEQVQVVIRVRPLNKGERPEDKTVTVDSGSEQSLVV